MKAPLLALLLLPLTAALVYAETPAPAAPAPAAGVGTVKHLAAPEASKALAAAAEAAVKAPEKAITILDVRSPEEFAEGHLKGAVNHDIASPDFAKSLAKLDPAKTYLVHCGSGGRSTRSLSTLEKLKFQSILHLDGGINAWKKAGLPVEPAAAPK
jgi:rhodanese-related sulfurtransferase